MPRLLKNETQRRLVVSQQALRLAFLLLANPKPTGYERQATDGALEVGLIGVAADLAVGACLYEIYGRQGVIRQNAGFYLTASEALHRFRTTLSSAIPKLDVLTSGVSNPRKHLQKLDRACGGFPVLFTTRATALHAGSGTSHDVAFCAGKNVADFLNTLAESPKWKPYLKDVPSVPELPKDRTLIAQELAGALSSEDKETVSSALCGIFLVLPELSRHEPEWLASLQRVQVTPRNQDISVLVKSLQDAKVGDIFKVGKGAKALATKIEPSNPLALPIYPTAMKKKFENLNDQWAGYVATANAELDKGISSLPPVEAVYRFAAVGIDKIGLPDDEVQGGMSAHSIWPFIAGALTYQGTKGPCFFAVRALNPHELGQLCALLKKASAISNRLKKALNDYEPLLIAAVKKEPLQSSSPLAMVLTNAALSREKKRAELVEKLKGRAATSQPPKDTTYEQLMSEVEKSDALALSITQVANNTLDFKKEKLPVLRMLIEAATEREDLEALAFVEMQEDLSSVATLARKAIQEIDYAFFGLQSAK